MSRLMQGIIILIVGWVIVTILSLGGGLAVDTIYNAFEDAGMHDVPTAWSGTVGDTFYLINLWYLACLLPGILGTIAAVFIIFQREGIDTVYTG